MAELNLKNQIEDKNMKLTRRLQNQISIYDKKAMVSGSQNVQDIITYRRVQELESRFTLANQIRKSSERNDKIAIRFKNEVIRDNMQKRDFIRHNELESIFNR